MSYLLDTNVVSEGMRLRPDAAVTAWQTIVDPASQFMSVATWAEIRYGIERLPPGARSARLRRWLEIDLATRFFGRVLDVDLAVTDAWGFLMAERAAHGRPMSAFDGLIAATAEVHQLTLVTRDVRDFDGAVTRLLNPWE